MRLNRILAMARNILLRLIHDRRTLGMIFIMPIIFIGLFGFAFAGEPEDIDTIVVNHDSGDAVVPVKEATGNITYVNLDISGKIVDGLDTTTLTLHFSGDLDEAIGKVENGEAWAVVYFPENFTSHFYGKFLRITNSETITYPPSGGQDYTVDLQNISTSDARMDIHVDGSNTQVAAAVIQSISETLMKNVEDIQSELAFSKALSIDYVYGENARFIDFFAPGIMALVVTMITIMLTIVSFVRERTNGTLDRLLVSPMKPAEIVLGYTVTFSLIALFQSIEIIAVGVLLFDIRIVGSIVLALLIIVLYAIGLLGLGFMLSTIARNEFQAVQFIPLVFLPSIILAGVIWPLESMPPVIRPVSYAIPLTYAAEALRSVMIRGWGPLEIGVDILALCVFAILTFSLSILTMRKKAHQS
ncbi:MAG: ABC transporter permease [Thermoplasmata archaeon]